MIRWEYLLSGLLACAGIVLLDRALGTRLVGTRRFRIYLGIMLLCQLAFDSYLTARPVTLYDPCCHLGPRIVTMPIEDTLFGAALLGLVVVLWEWAGRRVGHGERDGGAPPGGHPAGAP